jgi:hypothetical protein
MRIRSLVALSALTLSTSACLQELPPRERLGLVVVRAYDNGGTPVVRGSGMFYRVGGLVLVPAAVAPCGLYAYSATPGTGGANLVDAGTSIGFTVGAVTEQALRGVSDYKMPGGTYLHFTSGDSISLNVPGALEGFEPMTAKVRLAEAFTADTLPTWQSGVDMNLTWSAAPAAGSLMLVSLRYSNVPDATTPNIELACAFEDDGTGTIPGALLGGWGFASPASRSYAFMRIRETIVNFDDNTHLRMRSHFEQPLPSLIGATLRQ